MKRCAPDTLGKNRFRDHTDMLTMMRPVNYERPSTLYAMFIPLSIFGRNALGFWSPLDSQVHSYMIPLLDLFRANVIRSETSMTTLSILTMEGVGFFILMYEGVTKSQLAVNAAREIRSLPEGDKIIQEANALNSDRAPKGVVDNDRREMLFKIKKVLFDEGTALKRELRGISFTSWVTHFFNRGPNAQCSELGVFAAINMHAPTPTVMSWQSLFGSCAGTLAGHIKSYCLWASGGTDTTCQAEYNMEQVFTPARAYARYAIICTSINRTPVPFNELFVSASIPCIVNPTAPPEMVDVTVPHPGVTESIRLYTRSDVETSMWSTYYFPHIRPSQEATIRESRNLASLYPGLSVDACRALIEQTTGSSGLVTSGSTSMFKIMLEVSAAIHASMRIENRVDMLRSLRETTDAALGRIAEAVSIGPPSISPKFQLMVNYANTYMSGDKCPVPGRLDIANMLRNHTELRNTMDDACRDTMTAFEAYPVFRTALDVFEARLTRHRTTERRNALGVKTLGIEDPLTNWDAVPSTCIVRGGLVMSTESSGHMPGASLAMYNALSVIDITSSPFAFPQALAAVILAASSGVYEDAKQSGFHLGLFLPGEPGVGKTWLFTLMTSILSILDTCTDLTSTSHKHGTSDTDNSYFRVLYDECAERLGYNNIHSDNFTARATLPDPSAPAASQAELMIRAILTSLILTHARASIERNASGSSAVTDVSVTGCTPGFVIAAANIPSRLLLPNAIQSRFIDIHCRGDPVAMSAVQLEKCGGVVKSTSTTDGSVDYDYVTMSNRASQVMIAYHSVLVRSAVAPPLLPGAACLVLQLASRFIDEFGIHVDLGGRRQLIFQRVAQTCALLRAEGVVRSLGLLRPSRAPSVADTNIMSAFAVVGYEDIFHAVVSTQAFGDPVHMDVMRAVRDMLVLAIDNSLLETHSHVGMEMPGFSSYIGRNVADREATRSTPKSTNTLKDLSFAKMLEVIGKESRALVTADGYVCVTKEDARIGPEPLIISRDTHTYTGMKYGTPANSAPTVKAMVLRNFAKTLQMHARLRLGHLSEVDIYTGLFWGLASDAVAIGSTVGTLPLRGPAIVVRDNNVLVHLSMLVVCDYLSPLTVIGATLSPDIRVPVVTVSGNPCTGGYYTETCMLAPPSKKELADRLSRRNAVHKLCDRLAKRPHTPINNDMSDPPMFARAKKTTHYADRQFMEQMITSNLAKVYPYVDQADLVRSIAYPENTTVALVAAEDMRGFILSMNENSARDYSKLIDMLVAYYISLYRTFDGLMYRVSELDIISRVAAIRSEIVKSEEVNRWATLALQRIQIAFVEHGDHPNHVKQNPPQITMEIFNHAHEMWMQSGSVLPPTSAIDTDEECNVVVDGTTHTHNRRRGADEVVACKSYANWGQGGNAPEAVELPQPPKRRRVSSVSPVVSRPSPEDEEGIDEDLFQPIGPIRAPSPPVQGPFMSESGGMQLLVSQSEISNDASRSYASEENGGSGDAYDALMCQYEREMDGEREMDLER